MSNYPSSSPVAAGQATEADQYNFLRNDALYLGAEPGTSGNLRELLYQSAGTLRLSRSSISRRCRIISCMLRPYSEMMIRPLSVL